MPVLVDPKTGQQYDYEGLEGDLEVDQKKFGLVSPGEYAARQQAEKEGPLVGFGRKLGAPVVGLANLGMEAGILDKGTPEEQAQYQEALGRWGAMGEAHGAVNPAASIAGDVVGQGVLGAVAGGAGSAAAGALGASPLLGAGAGLVTESGLGGVSQEAVDAVTQKRDFSWRAAGMNGVVNLALGGAGAAAGRYWGGAARGADDALGAADDLAGTSPLRPPSRNWVTEIDPGEVPEAIGGRRPARSAGAAAAANQQYGGAARRVDVPEPAPRVEPRDVQVLDPASGEHIDATPEHLDAFRSEMQDAADSAIGDKSLEDLRALPLDEADRAGVEGIKGRADFQEHGDVTTDNFGSSKGGLPRINIEADGSTYLNNGRHRLAAARELDREFITARVAKYDAEGNTLWEATMPVRVKARPDLPTGRVANDLHAAQPFTDDLYEAATKSIDDLGLDKEAQFLASNRKELTRLAATNAADNFDQARKIFQDDMSVAVKANDARRMARRWTPEHLERQQAFVKSVDDDAEKLLSHIEQTQKAAADVRAGRQGPRTAEAIEAGGIDAATQKTVRMGLDRVRRSEGAERALAVDDLKRGIGRVVDQLNNSPSIDAATREARGASLREFYGTLQKGLESEDTFGAFGRLQRDTNAAFTEVIDPMKRIEARFGEKLGVDWQTGKMDRRSRAGALADFMRADPEAQVETIRDLGDMFGGLERMKDARRANGITRLDDLDRFERNLHELKSDLNFSGVLAVAERRAGEVQPGIGERLAGAAVDMVGGRIPGVGGIAAKEGKRFLEGLRAAPQMPAKGTALGDALESRLKSYSRNSTLQDPNYSRLLPQWLQGALKGHGGQVAGVAGVGIGAGILGMGGEAHAAEYLPEQRQARDELQAQLSALPPEEQQAHLQTAQAFARIQQKTEQRVQGAVTDLFALAKDPNAQPRHRSPQARVIDKKAAELDVPRHVARFMGKTDDPVVAWKQKSKTINDVMADPAKLARTMADNLGDLPRQQPEIFAKMVGQTMATVQYLHERMPGVSGQSALDPDGYPPTFEEISEWAGHYVGALHPLDSLDDLASNELVPEQMEAVQNLWPEGYQMFQATAMKEIHELSQQRKVIPLEALEQIDSALNLDGAGEPILSSGFADLLKQATAKQAEKMQTQAPPPPQPMQSQASARMGSSSLASLHGAQ